MNWNYRNVGNALLIGLVAAIALSCTLYAQVYPVPCAIVGTFVSTVATVLRLPVGVPIVAPPAMPAEERE